MLLRSFEKTDFSRPNEVHALHWISFFVDNSFLRELCYRKEMKQTHQLTVNYIAKYCKRFQELHLTSNNTFLPTTDYLLETLLTQRHHKCILLAH